MRQIAVLVTVLALTEALLFGQTRESVPESTSAELAAQLMAALQAGSLDSVAAADPAHDGRYLAALVYPKAEILAIAGNYSVPPLMDERLFKKAYRDAYVEINRAANREGRFFVQDLGADGLHAVPDSGGSPDIIYRDTVNSVIFNGDWKTQSLTRQAYMEAFTRADADYAALLKILIEQLKPSEPR